MFSEVLWGNSAWTEFKRIVERTDVTIKPDDISGFRYREQDRHLTNTSMEVTQMFNKTKEIISTGIELIIIALFCLMVVVI